MLERLVNFLGSRHGADGGVYGWMLLLGLVVLPLLSALGAWELRSRRARTLAGVRRDAARRPLRAAALVQEGTASRLVEAVMHADGDGYRLQLRETLDGVLRSEAVHEFGGIDALEQFLAATTALRLGDFRPG